MNEKKELTKADLPPSKDYADVVETASIFGVCVKTVRRWCWNGKLEYRKFAGRIRIPRRAIRELKATGIT
jgi:predicted site-specific integrase-resolvase